MLKPVVYPSKNLKGEVGKRIKHKASGYMFEKSKNGKWGLVWTDSLTDSIRELYCHEEWTLRAIADTMEVKHSIIQKLVNANNWMRSKKDRSAEIARFLSNEKFIRELYLDQRVTARDIAWYFGIDAQYVLKYLESKGIKRTCGEAAQLAFAQGTRSMQHRHDDAFEKFMLMDISNFDVTQYRYAVRGFTNTIMFRFGYLIDPDQKRSMLHHVDHRLSIADGFAKICKLTGKPEQRKSTIPLHVICHPANLILLEGKDNMRKGSRSSYTLAQLQTAIKQFESLHGEVFSG